MRIGFVVNKIKTEKRLYTTTLLAMTALNMGHEIWYISVADFSCTSEKTIRAIARTTSQKHFQLPEDLLAELQTKNVPEQHIDLAKLDILFLRNDPAEDVIQRPWARLVNINFGRLATHHGVIVLNDPNGLARFVNKMYLEDFPKEVQPKNLISRDREEIKEFIRQQNGYAVIKPLFGSGGHNVFLIQPEGAANLNQMIEAVSSEGYVLAQEYLSEAVHGDVRLFLMNGQPLVVNGCYAAFQRVRKTGDADMRNNLSAGASSKKVDITDAMLKVAEAVRPRLIENGMFLVGLDIVGDKLMEINVFTPGGLHFAEKYENQKFSQAVIQALEDKVNQKQRSPSNFDNTRLATLQGASEREQLVPE